MHAFRIGRIFGIELRIDVSWLFIAVLMTWNLFAIFARAHVEWSPFEDGAVAIAATLIFFGCVVLHELAHSLVAIRYGVPVRSITLFLFGGVSNIAREPPSASAEFLTAIVGPLTSIGLGVAFSWIASVLVAAEAGPGADTWTAIAALGPVATLLAWLGPINILIGLFNLIPGFPLDGGRVLRSIVWSITGDLRTSTRWVGRIGQVVGWTFIVIGIAMTFGMRVPFFGRGLVGGLWIAFIGWFLNSAAGRATVRLDIDDALAGHTVGELMRRTGEALDPEATLAAAVHDHFIQTDARALPVLRDGRFLGLVALADVSRISREAWPATPVKAIMRGVETLATITPDRPLHEAFERLAGEDLDELPVLDRGLLVGMLLRSDIARWLEIAWRGAGPWRGGPAAGRRTPPPFPVTSTSARAS